MKKFNLTIITLLLLCTSLIGQNSFKLLKGSKLVYEYSDSNDNSKTNTIEIVVEEVSPNLKLSYIMKNGDLSVTTAAFESFPIKDIKFRPITLADNYTKLTQLEANRKKLAGKADTTTLKYKVWGIKGLLKMGNISNGKDIITAKGTELKLNTYTITQLIDNEGKVPTADKAAVIKINKDKAFPYVVYLHNPQTSLTVQLKSVDGVELYTATE